MTFESKIGLVANGLAPLNQCSLVKNTGPGSPSLHRGGFQPNIPYHGYCNRRRRLVEDLSGLQKAGRSSRRSEGIVRKAVRRNSCREKCLLQNRRGGVCRLRGTKRCRENDGVENARRSSGSNIRNCSRAGLHSVGAQGTFQTPVQPRTRSEEFSLVGFARS